MGIRNTEIPTLVKANCTYFILLLIGRIDVVPIKKTFNRDHLSKWDESGAGRHNRDCRVHVYPTISMLWANLRIFLTWFGSTHNFCSLELTSIYSVVVPTSPDLKNRSNVRNFTQIAAYCLTN